MAPPSSVPANAAAVAGRGGSECRICPNPRLTAAAGVRPTPPFYPFILLSFFCIQIRTAVHTESDFVTQREFSAFFYPLSCHSAKR